MYDPDDGALPASFGKGDLPPIRSMRDAVERRTDPRDNQSPFAITEQETRSKIALTYGMITMIDDAIGRVLKTLEALDLADVTIVIFTSDHGDYMGDHGLMLSRCFTTRASSGFLSSGRIRDERRNRRLVDRLLRQSISLRRFWSMPASSLSTACKDATCLAQLHPKQSLSRKIVSAA